LQFEYNFILSPNLYSKILFYYINYMATRIRLARAGSKKRPFYRIVASDIKSPRDGKFIEKLGTYNPLLSHDDENFFKFDKERVEYWLKNGATPSERVAIFLYNNGFKVVEKYLPAKYPKTEAERTKLKKAKADKEAAEEKAKAAEEKAQ